MNLFALRSRRNKAVWTGTSSFFSGTSIGVISGACASCTSLGFLLVSTFGATGALASSLLSNFQLPLRIISVVLLVWSLYSVSKTLTSSCRLPARRR
jgi:NADH:ubiquinone oxidoreductase subunit 6 (subunit J)